MPNTPDLPTVRDQLAHAIQGLSFTLYEIDDAKRRGMSLEAAGLHEGMNIAETIADARRHLDRAEAALREPSAGEPSGKWKVTLEDEGDPSSNAWPMFSVSDGSPLRTWLWMTAAEARAVANALNSL